MCNPYRDIEQVYNSEVNRTDQKPSSISERHQQELLYNGVVQE